MNLETARPGLRPWEETDAEEGMTSRHISAEALQRSFWKCKAIVVEPGMP